VFWGDPRAFLTFGRPQEALTISSIITNALNRIFHCDTGHKANIKEEKGKGVI